MLDPHTIGILASLLSAIFFGLYPATRRYVSSGINDYMISMTLGVLASSVLFSKIAGTQILNLPTYHWILGLIAGGLWSLGTILYVYSVDCIGVGRATPVKNITAALGVVFGLVIFQEYRELGSFGLLYLISGTFLVVLSGKYLGSIQGRHGVARPTCPVNLVVPDFFHEKKKTALTAGLILALSTAFIYGIQSIPVRVLSFSTNSAFEFLPAVGTGALSVSLASNLVLTTKRAWREVPVSEHMIATLGGLLWTTAFVGLALGIKLVGLSISWPIAMSSTVFAVLYGLFIGKEVDFSSNRNEIIQGLFFGILGIIFLSMSM